jgi:hypothetical protein
VEVSRGLVEALASLEQELRKEEELRSFGGGQQLKPWPACHRCGGTGRIYSREVAAPSFACNFFVKSRLLLIFIFELSMRVCSFFILMANILKQFFEGFYY